MRGAMVLTYRRLKGSTGAYSGRIEPHLVPTGAYLERRSQIWFQSVIGANRARLGAKKGVFGEKEPSLVCERGVFGFKRAKLGAERGVFKANRAKLGAKRGQFGTKRA